MEFLSTDTSGSDIKASVLLGCPAYRQNQPPLSGESPQAEEQTPGGTWGGKAEFLGPGAEARRWGGQGQGFPGPASWSLLGCSDGEQSGCRGERRGGSR